MRMRFILLGLVALVTTGGLACSSEDGLTSIELPIATLEFTPGSRACRGMIEGGTCALEVIAMTADSQQIGDPVVLWSTSNSSIASVDEDGLVTARNAGFAVIRVSNTTDSANAQLNINVARLNPK